MAKSIHYNEELQSGQEYNYFAKLVLQSTNAIFIEDYLTLRRKHDNSTQGKIRNGKIKWKRSFKSMWITYLEIKKDIRLSTQKALLYKCIRTIYRQKEFMAEDKKMFLKELYGVYGFSSYNFIIMIFLRKYFNKGYGFRDKFKSQTKF